MPDPPEPTFSKVLVHLMDSRGLSQAKLAEALGVYDGNVRRWRIGKGIEIENVWKIADYFGVDRGELERLAGYGDSNRTLAIDSFADPEIRALFDADRAELHEDLRDIPQAFWTTVLAAQRSARRVAVASVKTAIELAQGQSINTPPPTTISNAAATTRRDQPKRPRGSKRPLTGAYDPPQAYQHFANARALATA